MENLEGPAQLADHMRSQTTALITAALLVGAPLAADAAAGSGPTQYSAGPLPGTHINVDAGPTKTVQEVPPPSPTKSRVDDCTQQSAVFQLAASMRDGHMPPKDALASIQGMHAVAMPLENLKKIINLVYFDQDFQTASPAQIYSSVIRFCLNGPDPSWQPLK